MAINFTPNPIASGYSTAKLNENFTRIDTALQDAVSRSGVTPNHLNADFDVNNKNLLNVNRIDTNGIRYQGEKIIPSSLVITGAFLFDGSQAMEGTIRAVDGTTSLPAYTFATDTNTGMYRISENKIGFTVGSTTKAFIDDNGITVSGAISASLLNGSNATITNNITSTSLNTTLAYAESIGDNVGDRVVFTPGLGVAITANSATVAQISQNLFQINSVVLSPVGYVTGGFGNTPQTVPNFASTNEYGIYSHTSGTVYAAKPDFPPAIFKRYGSVGTVMQFYYSTSVVGSISINGSTTTYNTSSDRRLKDVYGPLETSGEFIDGLKPYSGAFKVDGVTTSFLIADEVAEVSPQSVTGEKDEMDEEGVPVYQTVGYASPEIMSNIIAELQCLRKRVAELERK